MDAFLVVLAGLAHFGMVAVGTQVPRVMGWREDLARLTPANRRLFWVYGLFIVLTNAGFGAVSLAWPAEIAEGRGLAGGFSLLVGLYWLARLGVQFTVFSGPDFPAEARRPLARYGLGLVVLLLAAVYLGAFVRGMIA